MSGVPRVSVIVPARDSEAVLARTVARLAEALNPAQNPGLDPAQNPGLDPAQNPGLDPVLKPTLNLALNPASDRDLDPRRDAAAPAGSAPGEGGEGGEILIVENASVDDTWEVASRLADADATVPIRVLRSAPGLGCAYREGLRAARGDVALLTADDLPFGVSDLDSWRLAGRPPGVVVGSKAHPGSQVPRPWVRRTLTVAFAQMRRGLLDLHVGDTQGTLIVPTGWAREVLPILVEGGYLFPTELIYVATAQGIPITEIPVRLDERHAESPTRLRARDIAQMTAGLLAMRRRPVATGPSCPRG